MKHFVAAGALVALALVVQFFVLQRFGIDVYVHDTYWVIPLRKVAFWFLIAVAAIWFLIAVYKLVRHSF